MFYKILIFLSLFLLSSQATNFKVATYNIENLFDLENDGNEYKEYIPNKKSKWNHVSYVKKLKNISKVIIDINADIFALQEIESEMALKDLLTYTSNYKYYSFLKNEKSAIGVAVISKFPIINTEKILIKTSKKYSRPIQKVTIKVDNKLIKIYNNHWRSKRASENQRVEYALSLKQYLDNSNNSSDYIILGDLNSNYNEYQTFKYNKKLNNTYGITGINQVLNTTLNNQFITKENMHKVQNKVHYNPWLEIDVPERFSYKYKGNNNTPDHILLSKTLFDTSNISYVHNSFSVFKPTYLYKNNKITRWKTKGKNKEHLGIGYSDHLPLFAMFTTTSIGKKQPISRSNQLTISQLYQKEHLENDINLSNVIVIYKDKQNAIIKQKNGRAIYIYKQAHSLKLGNTYNLKVKQIKTYSGLKEIIKINSIIVKDSYKNFKNLYKNASNIDILNYKYQNEIITNLNATYNKGYLYYKFKNKKAKIRLYSKQRSFLPKNGENITIMSGHLGFFKSKPQIIIYKVSDFSVN